MKPLLLIFISALLLCACKKDNNSTNNPASDHYIKFKANGQLIKYEGFLNTQTFAGVQALQRTIPGRSIRDLYIDGGTDHDNNAGFIIIVADSIKAGQTIVSTSSSAFGAFSVTLNKKQYLTYSAQVAPQFTVTVHIDNHSEGWISGTFSGKVGHQPTFGGSYEEMTITEGSFQSKVKYYFQ